MKVLFLSLSCGVNANYGLRFTDDSGIALVEITATGLWLRVGGTLK